MLLNFFGVTFESAKDLFYSLGYKAVISRSQVARQYGSYEALIKQRLAVTDDQQASELLKEAKENYLLKQGRNKKALILEAVYKSAWAFLSNEQRESIIKTISITTNTDTKEIRKYILENEQ